ncbi:MAG: hypothetical protein RJB66_184 [Pseudomonadota bacterium]
MNKLLTLISVILAMGTAHAGNHSVNEVISALTHKGPQRLYCVDSEGQFDVRLTVSESGYSHATLTQDAEKTDLLARIISTNLYPRRVIEVVQLIKAEDKKHPLTLNLVKSDDCTHQRSGKTYPLRALLMDTKKANPELLNLFKGHAVCCQKH